jgi:hypothetical protein
VQATIIATTSRSELVINTTKELEPIRGGAELAIVSCTLSLPTKYMEVPIVIISTQIERLE